MPSLQRGLTDPVGQDGAPISARYDLDKVKKPDYSQAEAIQQAALMLLSKCLLCTAVSMGRRNTLSKT